MVFDIHILISPKSLSKQKTLYTFINKHTKKKEVKYSQSPYTCNKKKYYRIAILSLSLS